MNRRDLILAPRAIKDLDEVPTRDADRIAQKLEQLANDPSSLDIRKLEGQGDEWRLRVGSWRVRFAFDDATHSINILRILPRSRAYRD